MLDFFWSGCYRAGVIEPARKLKLSTIFIAAIAGLVGLGVFFFIGALIASFAAGPLHISTMEGARGYFAALVGMIAGVFGFIGAAWLVLRRRGVRGVRGGAWRHRSVRSYHCLGGIRGWHLVFDATARPQSKRPGAAAAP